MKKLKKDIKRIFSKYVALNDYRIFFFGSRVRGDNFLSSAVKFKIREEFDKLPVLYDFDIIDFSNVSEDFGKKAMMWIEYVN